MIPTYRFIRFLHYLVTGLLCLRLISFVLVIPQWIRQYQNRVTIASLTGYSVSIWHIAGNMLIFVLLLLVLFFLRNFMLSIKKTTVFNPGAIRNLRWIGCSYLSYSFLRIIFAVIETRSIFSSHQKDITALISQEGPIAAHYAPTILYGLIALILAAVFRYGYGLQEEQKLVI